MTPEPASVPDGSVALDESVLAGPYEPLTLDGQEAAGHFVQPDVSAAGYLSGVFGQSPLQGCLKGLPGVHQAPVPVKGVNTRLRRSHVFCQGVGWTSLEFFYELPGESLVEFKEEGVSIAHAANLNPIIILPRGGNRLA